MFITLDQVKKLENERLLSFDTALPNDWCNDVQELTGMSPVGHFVWLYQPGWIIGGPLPIDSTGASLLRDYYMNKAKVHHV